MKTHHIFNCLLLLVILGGAACSDKVYKGSGKDAISIVAKPTVNPIFKRMETNPYLRLEVIVPEGKEINYRQLKGAISADGWKDIAKLELYLGDDSEDVSKSILLGSTEATSGKFVIPFTSALTVGKH